MELHETAEKQHGAKSTLYRYLFHWEHGYIVYRNCFDAETTSIELGARQHKQAVFVDEIAAADYCGYRNKLIDLNGSDKLPPNRRPGN